MSNISGPARYSSLSLKEIVYLCAGSRDDEAWEEFVSRVGKPIGLVIMRTASLWGRPSRALVEDLIQVTYSSSGRAVGGCCETLWPSIPKPFWDT